MRRIGADGTRGMHRGTMFRSFWAMLVATGVSIGTAAAAGAQTAPAPATGDPALASPGPTEVPPAAPAAAPPPPAPQYYQAPPPASYQYMEAERAPYARPPRRSKGLMIAGFATLGGSYLFSVLVGALLLSQQTVEPGEICINCDKGSLFFIPIAGPWIAIPYADGGDGKAVSVIMGLAQLTGVALTIAGITKFVKSGRPSARLERAPALALQLLPTPHAAQASLRLRF
jgi:hypothetical protein